MFLYGGFLAGVFCCTLECCDVKASSSHGKTKRSILWGRRMRAIAQKYIVEQCGKHHLLYHLPMIRYIYPHLGHLWCFLAMTLLILFPYIICQYHIYFTHLKFRAVLGRLTPFTILSLLPSFRCLSGATWQVLRPEEWSFGGPRRHPAQWPGSPAHHWCTGMDHLKNG